MPESCTTIGRTPDRTRRSGAGRWSLTCAAAALVIGGAAHANDPACTPSNHGCLIVGVPGCNDIACCKLVCNVDPFCCSTGWDAICVSEANTLCPPCVDLLFQVFQEDRFGNFPPDHMQVVAMYDGDGTAALTIELQHPVTFECCEILIKQINNTDIVALEYDMKGFVPTGTFTVSGATPNGGIDGVAFGLYVRDVNGERWMLRSRDFNAGTGAATPNFVGGWPIAWSEATWDSKLPSYLQGAGFDPFVKRRQAQITLSGGQLLLDGAWPIPTGRCPGDVNGDGCINAADLGIILGGWKPNCCP